MISAHATWHAETQCERRLARRAAPRLPRVGAVVCAVAAAVLLLGTSDADAQPLTANVAIEGGGRESFFLGEPFRFQIQISGSDSPEKPDLSSLSSAFSVEELGGSPTTRKSVRYVNGRVTQTVHRSYVFDYRLSPKRAGSLVIPALTVKVGGKALRTTPVPVTVKKPGETADSKFRVSATKTQCYVGEPLRLTYTWYLDPEAGKVSISGINVPLLASSDFSFPEEDLTGADRKRILQLGNRHVTFRQATGKLDGKSYTTVTFRLVAIPRRPGTFTVDPATVAFDVFERYRQQQRRRPRGFSSDDLFDGFFGGGQQAVRRKVVVASNPLTLQVRQLPATGQPPGFAGHVGKYEIRASATPTEANVGDPITLTLVLSGPEYLAETELPSLHEQPALMENFKIPREIAEGRIEGRTKVFTQTLRATHAEVTEIPPIQLPYFDTQTGKYAIARTEPIPLSIKATKVVTAGDAEGRGPAVASGRKLAAWSRGIAHNYEGLDLLRDERHGPDVWLQSPLCISLVGAPPVVYIALLFGVAGFRRRNADPLARRSRRALSEFEGHLRSARRSFQADRPAGYADLLNALRTYMSGKLRSSVAGALTFADVQADLSHRGVDEETLSALKALFDQCEASRYAGGTGAPGDADTAVRQASSVVKSLERQLR